MLKLRKTFGILSIIVGVMTGVYVGFMASSRSSVQLVIENYDHAVVAFFASIVGGIGILINKKGVMFVAGILLCFFAAVCSKFLVTSIDYFWLFFTSKPIDPFMIGSTIFGVVEILLLMYIIFSAFKSVRKGCKLKKSIQIVLYVFCAMVLPYFLYNVVTVFRDVFFNKNLETGVSIESARYLINNTVILLLTAAWLILPACLIPMYLKHNEGQLEDRKKMLTLRAPFSYIMGFVFLGLVAYASVVLDNIRYKPWCNFAGANDMFMFTDKLNTLFAFASKLINILFVVYLVKAALRISEMYETVEKKSVLPLTIYWISAFLSFETAAFLLQYRELPYGQTIPNAQENIVLSCGIALLVCLINLFINYFIAKRIKSKLPPDEIPEITETELLE